MSQETVGFHPTRPQTSTEGFQGIFVVLFIAFFVLAVASILCAQNWRSFLPGAEGAQSMLDGVKSAVYTVMSQLS